MRGEVDERHSYKQTEHEELELADIEVAAGAEEIAEFGLAVVGSVLDGRRTPAVLTSWLKGSAVAIAKIKRRTERP